MREIKFRAKTKRKDFPHLDKIVYGTGVLQDGVNTWLISNKPNTAIYLGEERRTVHEESVSQFTGLKDRNGVEIYEGDIVNQYGFKAPGVVRFGTYQRKSFMNGDLQVKHHGWYSEPLLFTDKYDITWNTDVVSLVEDEDRGFEVIGNIWENEELVKDDSE